MRRLITLTSLCVDEEESPKELVAQRFRTEAFIGLCMGAGLIEERDVHSNDNGFLYFITRVREKDLEKEI